MLADPNLGQCAGCHRRCIHHLLFSNPPTLEVQVYRWAGYNCYFFLTNQDVIQPSALLRPEVPDFGSQCPADASKTTVSCLITPSVDRDGLRDLWIHFNGTNFIDNIRSLPEGSDPHHLRSLPTGCPLDTLHVGSFPFSPHTADEDVTAITSGFMHIFLCLAEKDQREATWATSEKA